MKKNKNKLFLSLIIVLLISLVGCNYGATQDEIELKKSINLYYPNLEDENYYYKTVELNVLKSEEVLPAIVKIYKENTLSGTEAVLSENSDIISLKTDYDMDEKVLKLDFNKAFLEEMNAGSSYEEMILYSVANTLCEYYEAQKISITIEGDVYESGHILLEQGDYIIPDYSKIMSANNRC